MSAQVSLNAVYAPSQNIVAREIEGEIIIVPLTAGVGNMEDELFTLNETGKAVWQRLDGKKPLKQIIEDLAEAFEAAAGEIRTDVIGLLGELLKRNIVVSISHD